MLQGRAINSRPFCGDLRAGDFLGVFFASYKTSGDANLFHMEQKMDQAVRPQQDLNFLPEPQGQGSLRPTLGSSRLRGSSNLGAGGWSGVEA